jgi:hypothetical protein
MIKFLNSLKMCWTWFYDRTVIWIIIFFIYIFSWGTLQKNELSSQLKEDNFNCRIQCLPQLSELIQNIEGSQCWCYNDVNTLVKPLTK